MSISFPVLSSLFACPPRGIDSPDAWTFDRTDEVGEDFRRFLSTQEDHS